MNNNNNSKPGYSPVLSNDIALPVVIEDAVAVPVAHRVEVTAPESLPPGYELHCEFQGRVAVVRVPMGGVVKGQKFVGDVISHLPDTTEVSGGHRIPHGHFRDGICDCFKHGCCHPMLCLACWCHPLALGQLMTRVHLNASGSYVDEARRNLYFSAFKVLAVIFFLYYCIDQVMSILLTPYNKVLSLQSNSDTGESIEPDTIDPTWVWAVIAFRYFLLIGFGLYMLVLLIRTRSFIRRRYDIPEQCCQGCDDCCCAFWLPCCTTLQLARHTADYDTHTATCCTETGLLEPMNTPAVELI